METWILFGILLTNGLGYSNPSPTVMAEIQADFFTLPFEVSKQDKDYIGDGWSWVIEPEVQYKRVIGGVSVKQHRNSEWDKTAVAAIAGFDVGYGFEIRGQFPDSTDYSTASIGIRNEFLNKSRRVQLRAEVAYVHFDGGNGVSASVLVGVRF